MSYRCKICSVSFGSRGSTIAHVCGSTSGEHSGVGYQRAGEFIEPVDDGDDGAAVDDEQNQSTTNPETGDSAEDPSGATVETAADGGRSDPLIPAAPGASTNSNSSTGATDAAPCCSNCGDERLAELAEGIEFDDAHGISHITDVGDVQCAGCGWVGEPR